MTYPHVRGEFETLQALCAGASIARYGDGEFKVASGGSIKSQVGDPRLAARLRAILRESSCLVGIPNIRSETPKIGFWRSHLRHAALLVDRPYVSSFISRPDSAPWIDRPEYWAAVETLWIDQDVTLVRGSSKSFTADDLWGALSVTEVIVPDVNAWAEYSQILGRVGMPRRALLCCGPTATVLAEDLSARGVQALDLGHLGMFLRRRRRGEPLEQKAAA